MTVVVKTPPANAGDRRDAGLSPGLGRSPGGGHGKPLQYSCLENPMDRRAWWAPVRGVTKSRTCMLAVAYISYCLPGLLTKSGLMAKSALLSVLFFFFSKKNWRTIPLQCCVGFYHTTILISHKYTSVLSLLNLPPTPYPILPLMSSQSARLGCVIQQLPANYLFHMC